MELKIRDVQRIINTSFHDHTFDCSVDELFFKFGKPQFQDNTGAEKVNVEFWLTLADGTIFTVYDWKIYRPIQLGEVVTWHIGAHSESDSLKALNFIKSYLKLN
jgi:hypothetical protein